MDTKRQMLRHYLAAIAYHGQKALRSAPESFADFRAKPGVRTPHELVFHIANVIGYARTFFIGGEYRPRIMDSFIDEIARMHEMLESFREHLEDETPFVGITPEQVLHGPFSDAMSHVGQLAMLRRLHGSPVPPENFIYADIDAENLTTDQPDPVSPDETWEAPGLDEEE